MMPNIPLVADIAIATFTTRCKYAQVWRMSYYVDFQYIIPNGFAPGPSQRAELESDVIGRNSNYISLPTTGDAFMPTLACAPEAQTQTVPADSFGNLIFPCPSTNQAKSRSNQPHANTQDLVR